MTDLTAIANPDEKISCAICHAKVHAIQLHLRDHHPDVTVEQYKANYPDAPLLSEAAIARINARNKTKEELTASAELSAASMKMVETKNLQVAGSTEWDMQIPDVDDRYVFDVDVLKTLLMGMVMKIPTYLWGHAGTGKSTIFEQMYARLHRPIIRIQHTGSTEEAHILGQMAADPERGTFFSPGPLPLAMKYGWGYLADEYDFSFPQVLAVYQAVLEGKPLIIKDAPADSEWRVVHPHPNFHFMATGNTNGSGDDSGLYLGTNIQNAANFERFGIVLQMKYMPAKQEAAVVSSQGNIAMPDAERLVRFANLVREAFDAKKIGATLGPRVLINAARIGVARASFMTGLQLSFLNRLTPVDKETCAQIAARVVEG